MSQSTPKADGEMHLKVAFVTPCVVIPQGDGAVLVKPGRPQEWMTVKEFALRAGLSRNTIYDHIGSNALPDRFVRYSGARRILIAAAAIEHWQAHWERLRGPGAAA